MSRIAFVLGSNGPEQLGSLKGLTYAASDARRFTDVITTDDIGFSVPTIEFREKDALAAKFDDLAASLTHEDELLFYFAGHGVMSLGELYLVLDNTLANRLTRTALPWSDMQRIIRESTAYHKVAILDCCHAGVAASDAFGGTIRGGGFNIDAVRVARDPTTAILLACGPDGVAREAKQLGGGVLTTLIVRALGAQRSLAVEKENGRVSLQSMTRWMYGEIDSNEELALVRRDKPILMAAGVPFFLTQKPIVTADVNTNPERNLASELPKADLISPGHSFRPRSAPTNIAKLMEKVAEKYQEVNVLAFSAVSGFIVQFMSYVARVHDIVYLDHDKQVGFLWAPNWTVMYIVLFPLYNFLFCGMVSCVRGTLTNFLEARVITAGGGGMVARDSLLADWERHVSGVSATLWLLLASVTFISVFQWYNDCYLPLSLGKLQGGPVDWSTIAIVQPNAVRVSTEMWFSALAYFYMAIALWLYTAIPVYGATFSWYLRKLSLPTGDFRLVLRPDAFQKELAGLTRRMFACTFLGLLASYLMQLQASYLKETDKNIFEFMFSGELTILHHLFSFADVGSASQTNSILHIDVTSSFTSWPVAIYALLMFTVYIVLLQNAHSNAKGYYLDHINLQEWRARMGLQLDAREIDVVRSQTFIDGALPAHKHFALLTIGAVMSCIVPQFGSVVIVTLCYAAARVFLSRQKRERDAGSALRQS